SHVQAVQALAPCCGTRRRNLRRTPRVPRHRHRRVASWRSVPLVAKRTCTMFFSPWRRWLLQQLRALKPVSRTRRRHKTTRRPRVEVLADRRVPASHPWPGASATTNDWSDPANWTGGVPGANGEKNIDLIFPAAALQGTNNNDLVGLTIEKLDFHGGGYTL